MRFCSRYVSDVSDAFGAGNVVAGAASADLLEALGLVDSFKAGVVHVTRVDAGVQIARGQRQAFLRSVRLPRRGRAGRKVTATLRLRHVGGRLEKRRVRLRLPSDLRPGRRRVVFAGVDSDASGGGDLFEQFDVDFLFGSTGGALGPRNRRTLLRRIEGIARYDGISARRPSSDPEDFDPGEPSYRDPELRISGRARATIRIKGPKRHAHGRRHAE